MAKARTAAELEEEVVEELTISDDLDTEFMRQASYFAHWAFRHARAEDSVRKHEEFVDLQFAQLYAAHKEKHPDSKENESKSFVRKSQQYKVAVKSMQGAKLARDILKAAVRAFEMRRDMLIQLGANRRHEYEGSPSITSTESANAALRRKTGKRRSRKAKAAGARQVLQRKRRGDE